LAPPHRLTLGHRLDSTDLQYAIDRGMESIGIPVAADLSDGGGLGSLCNDCAPPSSQLPPVQDGSGATAGSGGCTVSSSAGDHCGGGGDGGEDGLALIRGGCSIGGGRLAMICRGSYSGCGALGPDAWVRVAGATLVVVWAWATTAAFGPAPCSHVIALSAQAAARAN
jgi:hypothetical protein